MYKKICLFVIIWMLLLGAGCNENFQKGDNEVNNELNNEFMLPAGITEYNPVDRTLYINNFSDIGIGSSYVEIVEQLGEPSGFIGSGFQWPFYELADKSIVILHMLSNEDGTFSSVSGIRVMDQNGRVFVMQI